MAKIKLRFGENEIEIESRDFYVDNNTLGDVIDSVTAHMEVNRSRIIIDKKSHEQPSENESTYQNNLNYLNTLEDAEVHEPEFSSPIPIFAEEVKDKINFLEKWLNNTELQEKGSLRLNLSVKPISMLRSIILSSPLPTVQGR